MADAKPAAEAPADLEDLAAVRKLFRGGVGGARRGRLFCPGCGDFRSADVALLFESPHAKAARDERDRRVRLQGTGSLTGGPAPTPGPEIPCPGTPAVLIYRCRECGLKFTAFAYSTEAGEDLVVIPGRSGGMRTKNTPESVAFYLDQAARSESAGARSAAVAMYRGALEHLLFDQGYKAGMLGKKLEQLEAALAAGTAPAWARDLETDFLAVLKDLGNAAIHPNSGDTSKQSALDGELLARVKQVFLNLLDLVYEAPLRKKLALEELKKAAVSIKR